MHDQQDTNPCFKIFLIVLKKKTNEAPIAVTNHVKVVAIKAAYTASISEKKRIMASMIAKIPLFAEL